MGRRGGEDRHQIISLKMLFETADYRRDQTGAEDIFKKKGTPFFKLRGRHTLVGVDAGRDKRGLGDQPQFIKEVDCGDACQLGAGYFTLGSEVLNLQLLAVSQDQCVVKVEKRRPPHNPLSSVVSFKRYSFGSTRLLMRGAEPILPPLSTGKFVGFQMLVLVLLNW